MSSNVLDAWSFSAIFRAIQWSDEIDIHSSTHSQKNIHQGSMPHFFGDILKDSFVVSPKSGICDVVSGRIPYAILDIHQRPWRLPWKHGRDQVQRQWEIQRQGHGGWGFFSTWGESFLENSWNHRALGIFFFLLPRFFDSYPFGALIPVMCFSLVWWMKESKRKKKLEWDEITP